MMFHGAARLALLATLLALAAIGLTLLLTSIGVPFPVAALVAAAAAGVVQYVALRSQPVPQQDRSAEQALQQRIDDYRALTAALRHDLRGVLSPALMMSDRLLNHAETGVQRAGQTVVRSVERATALLSDHREALEADSPEKPPVGPV